MASSICKFIPHAPCFLRAIYPSSKLCASSFMTSSVLEGKHWDPKFKALRAKKVLKIVLPNFDEQREDAKLSVDEIRAKLKEKGIAPSREWREKPMFVDTAGDIFDPYVPPEGDGKISNVSTSAATDMYHRFSKKSKSYLALRKIRNVDYEFDVPTVAEKAKGIYIEAMKALAEHNEEKLHDLSTTKAYLEMTENVKNRTIIWNFIQCLEPPRIVHIRCEDLINKNDKFAQVTVRLHSQQTLAVYDRFGRLMHGSESTVKDVLEYIVFEKQIANPYGTWKITGKIIPDWLPPRDAIQKTYARPDIDKEFPEPPEKPSSKEVSKETADGPPLATA